MLFKMIALALFGAFAYAFPGFDGEHAMLLAALPLAAALTIFLLGPG